MSPTGTVGVVDVALAVEVRQRVVHGTRSYHHGSRDSTLTVALHLHEMNDPRPHLVGDVGRVADSRGEHRGEDMDRDETKADESRENT